MDVEVETHSGYKADEYPLRFRAKGRAYEVRSVLDRWYGPDASWFKVEADDGKVYILRHRQREDEWTLEAFRPLNP